MSFQTIFDTVLAHLRKQGVPSVDEKGLCRYRGLNKTSCAVGCLIPDDLYVSGIEGDTIEDAPHRIREHLQALADEGDVVRKWKHVENFLSYLQNAHDMWAVDLVTHEPGLAGEHWEQHMGRLADRFSLTYTPPGAQGAAP